MPHDYYSERVAARYDAELGDMGEAACIDPVVDVLARLAGPDGTALEFAVGTGRIALPLARRGIDVHGIELSEAMVAGLRAKPCGDAIPVVVGDMASTTVDGTFDVVYLVFNTIMNLTTQDEQVAVFGNAARHLRPGGCFVIEVMVPQLQRLAPPDMFLPFDVSGDHLGFDEYDVVSQRLVSHHFTKADGAFEYAAVPFRYVWPAELDLMARLAGLSLRDRWGDWSGAAFTATSPTHVSVWQKPEG